MSQPQAPEQSPPRSPRVHAEPVPKHRRCEEDDAEERAEVKASGAGGCSSKEWEGEGRWLQPRPVFDRSLILAPMVRVSTLPMRLLSLAHGADYVFTDEIIDKKLSLCTRYWNPKTGPSGSVDYCRGGEGRETVFRTTREEAGKCVLQVRVIRVCDVRCVTCNAQLGTADGVNALKAAEVVARDVAGIDINMGCPMQFSTHGGMGAQLLKRPEAAADIIATLKRNLDKHVSCKVRAIEDPVVFSEFLRRMESAGADAVTVHCRYTDDRPVVPARWNLLSTALDTVHVPVILNGDVNDRATADVAFKDWGVRGCMIARGAMANPSCFSANPLPPWHAQQQWVAAAHYYSEPYQPLKFILMKYVMTPKTPEFLIVQESKSSLDICRAYGLQDWAKGGQHWLQAAGAGGAAGLAAPLRHASSALRAGAVAGEKEREV